MTQTALDQYAKLEAEARYLDGSGAPAVGVVLSFGARSLMIVDFEDRAIAHWPLGSLAALSEPEADTLVLAPDRIGPERVEVSDPAMIEAISRVCAELHAEPVAEPQAKPKGRWRWRWRLLAVAVVIALGGVWLAKGTDLDGTVAALVDPATAEDIGARQTALLAQSLGGARAVARCVGTDGVAALDRLLARVAPEGAGGLQVIVLDHPGADALSLPGNRIVLTRGLLVAAAAPEEIAGVLAVEAARVAGGVPLRQAVGALDLGQKIELAAGAGLDEDGHAAVLAQFAGLGGGVADSAAATAAIQALDRVGLPRGPFKTLMKDLAALGKAYAGRRPMVLAAFDGEVPGGLAPDKPFQPALDDRSWLALGNICDRTRPLGG